MYELVILFDSGPQVVASNFAHPPDAAQYAHLEWPGRRWEAQMAIAVKIALPGVFPLWLKAELGVAGLLRLGVAVLANASHLRSLFPTKSTT